MREPQITLPEVAPSEPGAEPGAEPRDILTVTGYQVDFDHDLLQDVSFTLREGEKAALVGANGTGKTTLIRDILKNENPSIRIDEKARPVCLSQLQDRPADAERTVYQVLLEAGNGSRDFMKDLLTKYTLPAEVLDQRVCDLSGGEQNLLQLARIACSDADLLILDEPTSHLDLQAQTALEKAVSAYKGTVLMVSHDFYLVANCADFVLLAENNTVRRMRTRNFRKMVYEKYFDQKYLERDKKKQELEAEITAAFRKNDLIAADRLIEELEALSEE